MPSKKQYLIIAILTTYTTFATGGGTYVMLGGAVGGFIISYTLVNLYNIRKNGTNAELDVDV